MSTLLRPLLETRPDLKALHRDLERGLLELLCLDRPWRSPPPASRSTPEARMRILLARYSLTLRAESARILLRQLRRTTGTTPP